MEQNDRYDVCVLVAFRHDVENKVEKLSIMPIDLALNREKIFFCLMNDENFMNIWSTASKN
jgi:hypothetical protein